MAAKTRTLPPRNTVRGTRVYEGPECPGPRRPPPTPCFFQPQPLWKTLQKAKEVAAQGLLTDSGRDVRPTAPLASAECLWSPTGGAVLSWLPVTSPDGTRGHRRSLCGETPGVSIWAQKCWKEVELLTPSLSCPFPGLPLKVLTNPKNCGVGHP